MTTTTLMNTLGWTLIHFVWQGVLIGVLMMIALVAGNQRRGVSASRYRYAVALGALVLAIVVPLVTFLLQFMDLPEKIIQPDNINFVLVGFATGTGGWLSVQDSWLTYLLIAWFAGVFWGSARLLVSWLSLYMVQHSGIQPTPLWLEQDFRRLRQECRILRPVKVLISNVVRVPLTAGWMHPVILLPATAITGLQPEQIRLILRHELAHIQRYDYLVNWVQNLVQVMLFYHPVVHWIVRILNDERELCCDHEAISNRCHPVDYAKILVRLQEAKVPQLALAATGVRRGGLYRRVQRLLNIEAEHIASNHDTSRSFAWVFTVILSALVTTVGVMGSPSGHAAYEHTVLVPVIHPLSDIPDMVKQRTVQREQLIQYHQQTNFASFKWPSALAPEAKSDGGHKPQQPGQQSVPLDVLHRQMMRAVKQQLPGDSSVAFNEPMAVGMVAAINHNEAGQSIDTAELVTDLPDLLISNQKLEIPEPYIKVKPTYPRRLSGMFEHESVDLVYSIGPDGRPENMVLLSLNVHKDFSDAALEALSQWRFQPVSPAVQKLRISQEFKFLKVAANVHGNCSVTGGRLCPKFGHLLQRIQVNKPQKTDT